MPSKSLWVLASWLMSWCSLAWSKRSRGSNDEGVVGVPAEVVGGLVVESDTVGVVVVVVDVVAVVVDEVSAEGAVLNLPVVVLVDAVAVLEIVVER